VWLNGTRVITLTHDTADRVVGWSYDAAGNLLDDGTATARYLPQLLQTKQHALSTPAPSITML
jgi:hypothetical protein